MIPRALPFAAGVAVAAMLGAADTLRFGTTEIDPGGTAELPVMVQASSTLHGFSLAFFYDGRALKLREFKINEAFVSKSAVSYAALVDRPEENYAIIGILLVWEEPCLACGFPATPPGEERCLGWIVFETSAGVQPAPYTIQPQNWIGEPAIANTFSIRGGHSVLPRLTAGSVTIRNHNVVRVRSMVVEPFTSVVAVIEVDHKTPLGGIQVSFTFDNRLIRLRPDLPNAENFCSRAVNPCGLGLEALLAPHAIEQFVLLVENTHAGGVGWATCGMVFDYNPPYDDQVLPPAQGQAILAAHFDLLPAALPGKAIAMHLTDEIGEPPVTNKVLIPLYGTDGTIVELASVAPLLEDGTIRVRGTPRQFRRGFVNADGRVNIADAIAILGFLFRNGGDLACQSAADMNDDGRVNIADAVFLLAYLFAPAAPRLPPPSDDCGFDPTEDALLCITASPGCD